MTKLRAGLSALLLALLSTWLLVLPAQADDSAPITNYDVKVNLTPEGVAEVQIDFTMDFAQVRGRGPYFVLPTTQKDGANPEEEYVFRYSNIDVDSPSGASTRVHRESEGDMTLLRIGDEDRVNSTPQDYTVTYDVEGFIVSDHPESGLDEFNWDVIGPAWESTFQNISVRVTGPTAVSDVACFYGRQYQNKCQASISGNTAAYTLDSLGRREPMQVVAGFPAGTFGGVEQIKQKRLTLGNAFDINPATGAVAGGGALAAIAGLVAIRRRHGRDDVYLGLTPGLTPAPGEEGNIGQASGKAPVTVQFHPPKGALPGEIGTLLDTTADNVDVSATIVDLAVRGFLKIESDGGKQFTLHATPPPRGEQLADYESKLLQDLFQGSSRVTAAELRGVSRQSVLSNARSALYTTVVQKGWFKSNPISAQAGPMVLGFILILAGLGTAFLLARSGWSLIAVPLIIFGAGLMVISGKFRKRTALGSAYLAQAKGFELYLATAEKDTLRFEENEDIFSKYLPYAMIFGIADRWSNLFAQLGAEGVYRADTSWYVGADLMHGFAFANAMNNLTESMSSAMQAAQAAGVAASTAGSSGGSGFSGGGGFGGGGGGSW